MKNFRLSAKRVCPDCRSDELYAAKSRLDLVLPLWVRQWLVTKIRCERCLKVYYRPGNLFGGKPVPRRPRHLYD